MHFIVHYHESSVKTMNRITSVSKTRHPYQDGNNFKCDKAETIDLGSRERD